MKRSKLTEAPIASHAAGRLGEISRKAGISEARSHRDREATAILPLPTAQLTSTSEGRVQLTAEVAWARLIESA
jgi:hypothetical protein